MHATQHLHTADRITGTYVAQSATGCIEQGLNTGMSISLYIADIAPPRGNA